MFSFFQRKNIVSDIEWLGVDVHSHLLPGIDDGAVDIDQSLNYIFQLQELGYSKLFCTPHIYSDVYPNTLDTILPVLSSVKEKVKEAGYTVSIGAAAEYMADADFKINESLLTLPGNHILIEMSYLSETPNIDQIIFDLQVKGYKVMLAHPERYSFYHRDTSNRYQRFKDMGCFLQLNILSVLGYYGKQVKIIAETLLQSNIYDFVGTDLHHDKHLSVLSAAVRNGDLYKKIGNYNFLNKETFK